METFMKSLILTGKHEPHYTIHGPENDRFVEMAASNLAYLNKHFNIVTKETHRLFKNEDLIAEGKENIVKAARNQ